MADNCRKSGLICPPDEVHRKQFLARLVNERGWTRGAELGLWDGGTYSYVLEHCPGLTLIGIDAWRPLPGYEDWPHDAHEAQTRERTAEFGDRAIIYRMTTEQAANVVEDNSLDFVFIDADHSTPGVALDIEKWRPKARWLLGHDINWPSVEAAVSAAFPGYTTGPDHIWMAPDGYL